MGCVIVVFMMNIELLGGRGRQCHSVPWSADQNDPLGVLVEHLVKDDEFLELIEEEVSHCGSLRFYKKITNKLKQLERDNHFKRFKIQPLKIGGLRGFTSHSILKNSTTLIYSHQSTGFWGFAALNRVNIVASVGHYVPRH